LLGAEEVEGSSVVPLQVVTTVESEPMLALLTDRRLRAGLPLDLGDESGLGPFKRVGFLGTAGLVMAVPESVFNFGLGGTFGGTCLLA